MPWARGSGRPAPQPSERGQPRNRIARSHLDSLISRNPCGCSSMVELQLPKLLTWVRFPSPAPLPRRRQASRGNSGGRKILIAWENLGDLHNGLAPGNCPRLPRVAPAFARRVTLDLDLRFQVRIKGRDHHPSTRRQPLVRDRMRNGTSAIGRKPSFGIWAELRFSIADMRPFMSWSQDQP